MDDSALLRYSRHILLAGMGIEAQERISAAHALLVGCGGLGCAAAMYLAASGVGTMTLVDHDTVDLTNLQRQIGHRTATLGQSKVESLAQTLHDLNPLVKTVRLQRRADADLLDGLVPAATVVLDCSDNFATRHAVNAACVRHGAPLISGGAVQWDGQVGVFDTRQRDCPCYACAFPQDSAPAETQCATMGVFAPLVGIVGSMQAAEALRLCAGAAADLHGRLLMVHAQGMEFSHLRIPRDPLCRVCATRSAAP